MNNREPRPPRWLAWLVLVLASLLGGAEWVVGRLGYRIGR